MREPEDVRKELEADKESKKLRLPRRARKEEEPRDRGPLALEAGDEVVDSEAVLDESEAG